MAQAPDNQAYYASTAVVDWQQADVFGLAQQLAMEVTTAEQLAQRCQQWVKENIELSIPDEMHPVSCSASDVLQQRQGSSFSRSHLLAALLRANGLAAAFGYQRIKDDKGDLRLEGYSAVWLREVGWYPLSTDLPPQEPLDLSAGEFHYRLNCHTPVPEVVRVLQQAGSWKAAREIMPIAITMG